MDVLIIGNSYSGFNPDGNAALGYVGQFTAMANAGGQSVSTTASIINGGIKDYWESTGWRNATGEISSGAYDVVIIGGRPTNQYSGGAPIAAGIAEYQTYANLFGDLTDIHGADLVFAPPWPSAWAANYATITGGDGFGNTLHSTYSGAATTNNDAYAPVGLAYSQAYIQLTNIYGGGDNGQTAADMLTADGVHPSPLMAYLNAAVLYWTVFNEAPPSTSTYLPSGVPASQAQLMLNIAASAASSYAIPVDGSAPPPPPPPPTAEDDGAISGTYFVDENGNNIDDAGDTNVSGAVVRLTQNGSVVATTSTASNGDYSFDGLAAGNYQVVFDGSSTPFVTANAGNNSIDSDVISVNGSGAGSTGTIAVAANGAVTDVDAGVEASATPPPPPTGGGILAGRYFVDANDNNYRDATDPGVVGVAVSLVRNGSIVATTTTAGDGSYSFTGLSGSYSLQFSPSGSSFLPGNVGGNDAIDSDVWGANSAGVGFTGSFSVSASQSILTADAGVEAGGTLPPPPPPPPPADEDASIQGRYFQDQNGNNIDDAGDTAISGATVRLTQSGFIMGTTTTASDGSYSFADVAPGGNYIVYFNGSSTPFVTANVGSDATDSDVVSTNSGGQGGTASFSVSSGQTLTDVDAGVEGSATPPPPPPPPTGGGTLAGRYFVDANGNKLRNDSDPGVGGATVELVFGWRVVDETTTAADGSFAFTGLEDGSYSLRFGAAGAPFVAGNLGSDDTIDSDVWGSNGAGVGFTGSFAVSSNQSMLTADAGVQAIAPILLSDADFIV